MNVVILVINYKVTLSSKGTYCTYVTGRIEAGSSGFGAGHVLPDYGHVQGLLLYHCLL